MSNFMIFWVQYYDNLFYCAWTLTHTKSSHCQLRSHLARCCNPPEMFDGLHRHFQARRIVVALGWTAACTGNDVPSPDVGGLVEWRIDRPPIMRDDAVRNKSLGWSFFLLAERLVYWANRVSGRLPLCALVVNVIEKNWPSALLQWETCCAGDWLLDVCGKGTFHHAENGI